MIAGSRARLVVVVVVVGKLVRLYECLRGFRLVRAGRDTILADGFRLVLKCLIAK